MRMSQCQYLKRLYKKKDDTSLERKIILPIHLHFQEYFYSTATSSCVNRGATSTQIIQNIFEKTLVFCVYVV